MRYHNITTDDMLNGEGLRVVLWVAGCIHECKNCHNPITWDIHGGLSFDQNAKEELFAALNKPYVSGVTLSGGDPLHPQNREDSEALVQEIKTLFPQKTIWLYTGYLYEEVKDLALLQNIDVLVDGPFEEELKATQTKWVGSSNQRVLYLKKA